MKSLFQAASDLTPKMIPYLPWQKRSNAVLRCMLISCMQGHLCIKSDGTACSYRREYCPWTEGSAVVTADCLCCWLMSWHSLFCTGRYRMQAHMRCTVKQWSAGQPVAMALLHCWPHITAVSKVASGMRSAHNGKRELCFRKEIVGTNARRSHNPHNPI